jgi:hypothetical protein
VLTFAGIGCGGLLALLVLFVACNAIVGGGGDDAKDTASSGEGEDKKKKGSKQKAEEETVAIGQPLAVGDVEWTITDARVANELIQPGISPKNAKSTQGSFVIVDFNFMNNGSEVVTLDNESLALVDNQQRESKTSADTSIYVPQERRLFLERINPGVAREGTAIFQVAPGASGFRLQAGDAKMFTDENGYVDLGF